MDVFALLSAATSSGDEALEYWQGAAASAPARVAADTARRPSRQGRRRRRRRRRRHL